MMAKRSRIAILVASIALGLLYVLPVWTIDLEAPQYPEGIGMVIRLNTIEGQKEHDLNNINGLNHYIGMQAIEPDSIPELRWMPIIAAVLIGLIDTLGRSFLDVLLLAVLPANAAESAGPALSSMLIYIFMVAVLFVRPQGLFPPRGA